MANDAGSDFGEDADWEQETIMSIDLRGRDNLGCSYYAAREQCVRLLSQTEYDDPTLIDSRKACSNCCSFAFLLTHLVKLYVQPTTILISTRVNEDFEAHLNAGDDGYGQGKGT